MSECHNVIVKRKNIHDKLSQKGGGGLNKSRFVLQNRYE